MSQAAIAEGPEHAPAQGRRLAFERLCPEPAAALYPLINDWEVVRMLGEVPWPLSLAHLEAHTARGAGAVDEFVVIAAEGPVGVASLKRPGSGDPPRLMARLGYWLGRHYWNQGYATEAVASVIGYARSCCPSYPLGAGVFADNPASQRVLEKLGFRKVGEYATPCRARGAEVLCHDMRYVSAGLAAAR